MGADLIAYSCYVPLKSYSKIIEEQLTKLRDIIKSHTNDGPKPTDPEDAASTGTADDQLLEKLREAGMDISEYEYMDASDRMSIIQADIDAAEQFDAKGFDYRDCFVDLLKINDTEVLVCFAGELSFGDTPQGAGYQELQALARTGLMTLFYNAVKWDGRE